MRSHRPLACSLKSAPASYAQVLPAADCSDLSYRELGEARWSKGHFPQAIKLFHEFSTSNELADFLTIAAYDAVVEQDSVKPSKL